MRDDWNVEPTIVGASQSDGSRAQSHVQCGDRFVRVDAVGAEGAPTPRPQRADSVLPRDLISRECLPLDHAEPRLGRLEPLPPADPGRLRRVEAEHEAEARPRHVRALELHDQVAHPETHTAARDQRPERVHLRSVVVRLVDDVSGLRRCLPPERRLAGDRRIAVHKQGGLCAALGEPLHQRQDVCAIRGVGRLPGRGDIRALELIERDPRRRAVGGRDRLRIQRVGGRHDRGGVGRSVGLADDPRQMQLEVGRADTRLPEGRAECGSARGDDDSRPREDRPNVRLHGALPVVDPQRARSGQPAFARGGRSLLDRDGGLACACACACACTGRYEQRREERGDSERPATP